jgi:hypothetical protein
MAGEMPLIPCSPGSCLGLVEQKQVSAELKLKVSIAEREQASVAQAINELREELTSHKVALGDEYVRLYKLTQGTLDEFRGARSMLLEEFREFRREVREAIKSLKPRGNGLLPKNGRVRARKSA